MCRTIQFSFHWMISVDPSGPMSPPEKESQLDCWHMKEAQLRPEFHKTDIALSESLFRKIHEAVTYPASFLVSRDLKACTQKHCEYFSHGATQETTVIPTSEAVKKGFLPFPGGQKQICETQLQLSNYWDQGMGQSDLLGYLVTGPGTGVGTNSA